MMHQLDEASGGPPRPNAESTLYLECGPHPAKYVMLARVATVPNDLPLLTVHSL
jgi:hypothetical protein